MSTIHFIIDTNTFVRIFLLGFMGFLVSMLITPIYTTIAYKKEWWKKQRSEAMGGIAAPVYKKLHAAKHKRNVPNMAGMIFVVATVLVTLCFNLSRGQTWLPLAAMLAKLKLFLYSVVAVIGGWWFYNKLGVNTVFLPVIHHWHVGVFIIPIFWLVVVATANAVNMSDGLDGLAGGLLSSSFLAYAVIAAIEGKYGLAAFCFTIVGALLSYTWFNIFPARFFMGDVGAFALGTALGVIAMQTDTVYILPIIGAVYVMEAGSVIINRTSRKLRHGKKVFLSSPIHHHFEAIGWPETKVTMRFWILGQVSAVVGLVLFLLGRYS